jgi:hypothetical protein
MEKISRWHCAHVPCVHRACVVRTRSQYDHCVDTHVYAFAARQLAIVCVIARVRLQTHVHEFHREEHTAFLPSNCLIGECVGVSVCFVMKNLPT